MTNGHIINNVHIGVSMKKEGFGVGRAPRNFGVFKDAETDWAFKRTLVYATEKAAEIGECLHVSELINEKEPVSWITEWEKLGDRLHRDALESLKKKNYIDAKEEFLRASNYYRTAEYACNPLYPDFTKIWEKSVVSFKQAARLSNFYFEEVRIPFKDGFLPAYFGRPIGDIINRPTLFSIGGNDSTQEELFMGLGFGAIRRGFNFFTFEYPGHRGAVHTNNTYVKNINNYKVAFKAAFDWLEKKDGVDKRIALSGFSFGGFVSSYIATIEKRVAALIPDSPIIDIPELVLNGFLGKLIKGKSGKYIDKIINFKLRKKKLMKAFLDFSRWTWGFDSLKEEFSSKAFKEHTIVNDIKKITVPTLCLVSKDEGELLVSQAKRMYEGISSEKKDLRILTLEHDGTNDHCQLDNLSKAHQLIFSWLKDLFE
jgi:esterase/lipase